MSSQQDHQNAPEQVPRSTQDMQTPDQNEVESHETSQEEYHDENEGMEDSSFSLVSEPGQVGGIDGEPLRLRIIDHTTGEAVTNDDFFSMIQEAYFADEAENDEASNESLSGSLHHSNVIGSEQFEEFDRELHYRLPRPEDLNFGELSSIVDELQERIDLERQQEANPERERFILHINDSMCQLTLLMIGLLNSSLGI